ncbi:MAG TPA: metallophosphoesterase [Terriglobales bacterium]
MMKRTLLPSAIFILLLASWAQEPGNNDGPPSSEANTVLQPRQAGALDFIAYGDMRFTDPHDQHNTNPRARRALVQRIAKEDPELVAMTGDIVLTGDHASDWQVYASESKPLRDAGIKLFPTIGNHDVRDDPQAALPYFFKNFPETQGRRWYSVQDGPVFFIILDSESDESDSSEQGKWLQSQLDHLPSETDFLFLVFHHPCYTRSMGGMIAMGGHPARTQEQHLATLLEQRARQMKAKVLVVSGHVHNYERYQHGGVTYLVSGGGGATPVMVRRSSHDFYKEGGPTYHYIKFHVAGHHLKAEMVKYEDVNGGPVWKLKDSFELTSGQ